MKLAVVLILAVVGFYIASPWIQLSTLKSDLKRPDVVALDRDVDWNSVRAGLKEDADAQLLGRAASEDNPLVKGLIVFAGQPTVDMVISNLSAATLVKMLQYKAAENRAASLVLVVSRTGFTGFDEFTAWVKNSAGSYRVVMRYEDFRWVVVRVVNDNLLPVGLGST